LSSPPNFRANSKPNKTNHFDRKKIGPALPTILPQKRTIKAVVHRANSMEEDIRKTVPAVKHKKVHKSAQKTPGNHPTKPTPSTT
jgi:hypothetical protein